jgi:membrane-bound lytic murein transglycosylase D
MAGTEVTTASISRLLRLPIPDTLTFCGESVPLDREDVSERLDLELIVTLGSPVRTTLWLKRIPRYFPLIEHEIESRGLPPDLKYVAVIESNLRASAVSSAGAVGPWQFIRSTGDVCGLERTRWRDERRDWLAATRAALDHLADLREHLGSWPLALAAYNAGEGRVTRSLETQGETDFYGLRLPRETERYVFRALAAKLVVEDPKAYGIDLDAASTYPPNDTAVVDLDVKRRSLPVAVVAEAAGVSYRWLVELNPWIRAERLPRGAHRIVMPADSRSAFAPALSRWEADNPEPKTVYYQVRRGDNLSVIARRHNVRLRDLCAWNGLSTKSIIRPGQKLMVQTVN